MTFGERLRELRTEAKMTQDELGAAIGVSPRVVGYYESDNRFPRDSKTLVAIAKQFQISLDYLLDNPVRTDSACPSRYCYVKNMNSDDRKLVNEYIRFLRWQKHEDVESEEV